MLTLILQTQEGHQIELNVQPEDTFRDLKSQFANYELAGLSDSLQQLITGGASVLENTKIFDFVTGSVQEWLGTNAIAAELLSSQSSRTDDRSKECSPRSSADNQATMSEQPIFPLPVDQTRLPDCSTEIGKLDPHNKIFSSDTEECQKFFSCDSHYDQEPSILLADHQNQRLRSIALKEIIPTKDILEEVEEKEEEEKKEKSNVTNDIEIDSKNYLDLSKSRESSEHPGILCRLCGKLAVNPIHLYAVKTENIQNHEFSVADKINLCLPVTISVTDPLPKQICHDCDVKLNVCHDLAIQSLLAEAKLKKLLRKRKLCVEVNAENCPLCIDGNMKMLKRSGIYRKEDWTNISRPLPTSSPKNEEKIQSERSNDGGAEIRSWEKKIQFPVTVCHNFIDSSTTTKIDAALQSENSQDDITLSLPIDRTNSSTNCSKIVDSRERGSIVDTRDCQVNNRISSGGSVVSKSGEVAVGAFEEAGELQLDDSGHELATVVEESASSLNNSTGIRCDDCGEILTSEGVLRDHDCSEIKPNDFPMSIETKYLGNSVVRNRDTSNVRNMDETPTEKRAGEVSAGKVGYFCQFCNREFTQKASLEKHTKSLHKDSLKELLQIPKCCWKCKVCCEAFAREKDAEAHARKNHLSLSFFDERKEENEERIHCEQSEKLLIEQLIVTRLYVCEYCELRFTVPSSVHEHRELEHSSNNGKGRLNKYTCTTCNLTFDSHRELTSHKAQRSHRKSLEDNLGIKQFYVCKYCDKSFLHHTSHTSHVLQHTRTDPRRPYLCRVCNLNFVNYREISRHRDEAHPYYQLILHERSSFVYNCQYCHKEFSQEVALIKHIRMHTGERPYKCTICAKGFSQSSGLYTHLRVHSDVRPYACTKCSRTFKIKGDCDNHMKKHAGNRPYKCEFCNKAFMTQHVYSQHCKIHTNERPYKCNLCGQAFRRSHVLTVHMRRHTGEKPHGCDMCPKTYRQRGDLSKHRKTQHGIVNGSDISGMANLTKSPKFASAFQSCPSDRRDEPQQPHDPFSSSDHFPKTSKLLAAADLRADARAVDTFILTP